MNAFTLTHRTAARFMAVLAVFSLLMSMVPMQAFAVVIDPKGSQTNPYTKGGPDKEIRICHVGNKGENYVVNTPAWDSIDTAHSLENHNQDIIPSFWYLEKVGNDLVLKYDAGRNWENNTLSQEIWRNNCAGSPTALLTVKKVLVDEPQGVGADDFSFKITGANDFSANYSFDSDATNEVALQLSNAPFTVVENEANGTGYTTGSVGCIAVELTMNGATCTITNTYEEGPVLCTDTTANNYNQEGSCTYDSDVTICKLDNNQNPLSGWTVSLTQGDVVKSGVTAVETGCVTLQDVPYGAYTLGETMQANWENVSGNGTQVTVDGLTESFSLVNKYPGCTTVGASNYNAAATFNNGTCEFPPETEIIKACKYNSETEGALAGWEMTISNDKVGEANVTFTGVTGENGCYSVAVDPLDGPFFVTEEDRAGWTQNTTEVTGGAVNEGQDGMEYCTFFAPVQSTQENTFSAAAVAQPEYSCSFWNTEDEIVEPVCKVGTNLLKNGSFEDPAIKGDWTLMSATDWVVTKVADATAVLGEIWANGFMGGANDGNQHVELDSTEPTVMTQSVVTVPGATYELRFDYRSRPDTAAGSNGVEAYADATLVNSVLGTQADWATYTDTFVAGDASTDIAFKDVGSADSLGTLLDNAVLCLVREPAPVEACELTVVSDITNTVDGNPAALTWVHGTWLQEISGSVADWIWGTEYVVDPSTETVQTFTKTFTWNGPVSAATLTIAADNAYEVKVNGVTFGSGDGFASADVHDMTAFLQANIVNGTNTLEIVGTNWAAPTQSATANPAGIIYDLNIVGNTTTDCKVIPDPEVPSCELTASDTSIRRGSDVTLSWDIVGDFVQAVITNNQNEDEDPTDEATGSTDAEDINRDTTYTLTVYGDDYDESEEREIIAECEVDIDVRTSGGGGGGRRDRDDDEPTPTPQVLGEQVSVVPLGAADAGAGSTSPIAIPSFGLAAAAFIGRSRK